jgi:hypothetical protein
MIKILVGDPFPFACKRKSKKGGLLGHIIEELGLGDARLGDNLLCMVFWLLMMMYL